MDVVTLCSIDYEKFASAIQSKNSFTPILIGSLLAALVGVFTSWMSNYWKNKTERHLLISALRIESVETHNQLQKFASRIKTYIELIDKQTVDFEEMYFEDLNLLDEVFRGNINKIGYLDKSLSKTLSFYRFYRGIFDILKHYNKVIMKMGSPTKYDLQLTRLLLSDANSLITVVREYL